MDLTIDVVLENTPIEVDLQLFGVDIIEAEVTLINNALDVLNGEIIQGDSLDKIEHANDAIQEIISTLESLGVEI